MELFWTVSLSDSVDKLDDELDVKYVDDEDDLYLFSGLDFGFFLFFLLERFSISGLDEEKFIFLFLDLFRLPCLLVEEVSWFPDTLFAGSSYELSPALSFFALNYHWS